MTSPGTRVYVAGPMTGLQDLNFPAFHAAAAQLRAIGFDVVNPAEINADKPQSWEQAMRRDIAGLVTCDMVAMLEGWENSRGANLEVHIALSVGIKVVDLGSLLALLEGRAA